MRRSLAIVGIAVLALVCAAPSSWASESIPDGNWAGSALDAGPATVSVSAYQLAGTFRRSSNRQIAVKVSASPAGSGPCAAGSSTLPAASTPRSFNITIGIPCNGTYTIVARADTTDNNVFFGPESASLTRTIDVAAPAPKVTGVDATAVARTITVVWDDMAGAAPDLLGYVVQRKIDGGSYKDLATVEASDPQSYEDADLPAKAGQATYRVLSTRPSPNGDKVSAASNEAATQFTASPTTSTTTSGSTGGTGGAGGADGSSGTGGTGGSGDSAGGGGGFGGSSASDGGARQASAGGSRAGVSPPRVFSGTFLPPLLRPASQTISTTTTLDTGFNESLPYEKGASNPVLPKDAMASIVTDSQPGRGMAIPMATALVLAIWAIHLRMLARAARPLD